MSERMVNVSFWILFMIVVYLAYLHGGVALAILWLLEMLWIYLLGWTLDRFSRVAMGGAPSFKRILIERSRAEGRP